MKAAYIGLDVGTSGCKAAVMDERGRLYMSARREYGFEMPEPGMVELNPQTVWEAVCKALSEVAGKCCGMELKMMAVSSIGEAVVMTDREGNILRNGITYLDGRGAWTSSYIREKADEKWLHSHTGVPVNPMYTLNRHLWLRKHQPDLLEKTEHYFLFGDFITWKLTGERVIDPSSASRTMLFDAGKLSWSKEVGSRFEIPVERFSQVEKTGTVVGSLCPEAAGRTGFPETLKVVLGCHDQCSALLGAGAVSPGDIMAGEGSTESINLIVRKEDFCENFYEKQLCFEPYVIPGQYIVPVGQLSHGTSIRWFVENIWRREAEAEKYGKGIYELAEEECAPDSGEVYFLPYLSRVKSMDNLNQALGVFLGLDVGTKAPQMYRALLEGLCFESRKNFEIFRELKFPIRRIAASGGCSRSALFMQMKADVLDCPVRVLKNPDAGTLGLAMICAVADGVYRDYGEAAEASVQFGGEYRPRRDYREKYGRYLAISQAVKDLYKNL